MSLLSNWRYKRTLAKKQKEAVGERALVVLSGGLDSTTMLYDAIRNYACRPMAVSFNYGSKHNANELDCARLICSKLNVRHCVIDLTFMGKHFNSSLLQHHGPVPDGHYADASMKATVVPFRNGIMLAVAAGYAESKNCDVVLIGSHAGDHAIYPDCRATFTEPMAQAIFEGTYKQIRLERPFERLSKADIVILGSKLNVPFGLTWSCYKGAKQACGRCGTCTERLSAFEEARVRDPLIYQDPSYYLRVRGG